MWKTGHSLVKAKLRETGAPLGGEMSGHIFFKDRWYGFDDGLYSGARLLELLTRVADPSALLNALPQSDSTPELHLHLQEGENVALIDKLRTDATLPGRRAHHRHRRPARRIPGRLRPGAFVEHHAGGGDALRGRDAGSAGAASRPSSSA